MVTFPNDWMGYLNGVIIIWFAVTLYIGYKKGFLLHLVDVVGTFVSLFAAWIFAPVFVQIYQFFKVSGTGFLTINQLVVHQMNQLIWFVILFIVIRIVLLLVTPLATVISKVPLVKQVNSAVGGVFSIAFFALKLLLICVILSTPIIKNGQDVIDNTWLVYIERAGTPIVGSFDEFMNQNTAIQSIIMDQKLSPSQEDAMVKWLQKNGFNEIQIREYLEKYE
ncbi:CvpA family protein [Erysipelothrix tonsillarum]|uniref:CvpA family protein n=1 Tax=Erysipelothrix tonsillarum TaxID=38402 RepID=UPI0003778392|nr:CvpA family protein [Erysipelothrix tonsillarum]